MLEKNGLTETWWNCTKQNAKSSTWDGTIPCKGTGLTFLEAVLRERQLERLVASELIMSQQCTLAVVKANCTLSSTSKSIASKMGEEIIPIYLALKTTFWVLHQILGAAVHEIHCQIGSGPIEIYQMDGQWCFIRIV